MRWALRALVLLVGVLALVGGTWRFVGPFGDLVAYTGAASCSERTTSADACIGREAARVQGKRINYAIAPGEPSQIEPVYLLSVARASGRVESLEVVGDEEFYDLARPGAQITLETWRGEIVRLTLLGGSHTVFGLPGMGPVLGWSLLAVVGLGLLVGSTLSFVDGWHEEFWTHFSFSWLIGSSVFIFVFSLSLKWNPTASLALAALAAPITFYSMLMRDNR